MFRSNYTYVAGPSVRVVAVWSAPAPIAHGTLSLAPHAGPLSRSLYTKSFTSHSQ